MNKEELISAVKEYGEAIINYRSAESNKLKYNVCTLDFDNAYIQAKQNRAKETDDTVLMYCWDVDAYRLVKAANITSVVPLSNALKEGKNVR
jgi:molybdopterin converting factor small subunit